MLKKHSFVILFFVLGYALCFSQTKMPSFFSDNMILQQQENVSIWGTDKPGSTVNIQTSWGEETNTITDSSGNWKTKIPTKKASFDIQKITVKGSSTIILQNVLIGEVWFCSGQSNMEMPMEGLKNAPINQSEELINTSNNPNIRLFNTPRTASNLMEVDVVGNWEVANPESVKKFSAVGYLFGRTLFDKLQIPIGIIEAAWGGTSIQCWLPKSSIANHPEIKIPDSLPEDKEKQTKPTFLYNAMIHPFQSYGIKGFLWYQGEANRGNASLYKGYMNTLIGSWREQWQQKNAKPFYFVQIAPYDYNTRYKSKKDAFGSNVVREAQSFAARDIPHTGLVVTTDVGNCDQIHPPEKYVIAKRLANLALTNEYNFEGLAYRSPEYKSYKIKKDKAIVTFDFFGTNKDNHTLDGKRELKNFVIAGEDKVFYPAIAKMNKNKELIVYSDKVTNPIAVRYGFVDCLEGTLFSNAGLPISPFRTDNWEE